jgi:branched-chain amino acid transport system permease protein
MNIATKKFAGVWVFSAFALLAISVLPQLTSEFTLLKLMIYIIMSILALSLAFIWGFGGILSFGHGVFFGIGAYAYAVAAINFGETTLAFILSLLVPALFAAVLGYFLFFGRISDVYLGAITLTVTLIFFNLVNSTSGPQYRIGKAALGGFNGIPAVPRLNVPGFPDWDLSTTQLFSVCVVALALVYAGLRYLIASDFGRIIIAIRENETRVELLGYDARKYKLATFVIGGAIAGLAGCLFANWGAYTSPTVFALGQSVQIIIWVVVGGVGTLVGPIVGCFLIQWLTTYVSGLNLINNSLLLGGVLTLFVLLLPQGLLPTLKHIFGRLPSISHRKTAESPAGGKNSQSLALNELGGDS